MERIEKAERVVRKLQATIEFVSGYVGQQVAQLDLTPPVSFVMHAKLIPSYYLDRVAQTRSVSDGEPLRELVEHQCATRDSLESSIPSQAWAMAILSRSPAPSVTGRVSRNLASSCVK